MAKPRTPWTHRPLRTLADLPAEARARAAHVHERVPGPVDPEAHLGTCPGCHTADRRADEMIEVDQDAALQAAFPGLDFVCSVCVQHAERMGRI